MATDNAATIERFYKAFARRDAETMASCYAPNVHFEDPVFPGLDGDQVGAMWAMLCARGKDLEIAHRDVSSAGDSGSVHWDADYTFSATGRKVHNSVDATFEFDDQGRIVRHIDDFDFHAWSKQALGLPGVLLGWTGFLQRKVQKTARAQLEAWMAREATKG